MFLGKTLYISTASNGNSGVSVISDRNYRLVSLNSSLVLKYAIDITLKSIKQNFKSIFIDLNLVKREDCKNILEQIKINKINTVFIDTSLIGNVAKEIKANFPDVFIISFFHNVEYKYFKELIRVSGKFQHYFTLILIKKAEKQLVKFADAIITLNERDSNGLNSLYKKKADLILPTSFIDDYDNDADILNKNSTGVLKLLFVGSYFPPNIYAVDWFIKNVLAKIKREVEFYIVGNGFENHQLKEIDSRIKLVGRVKDVSSYYYLSNLVVAPVFHGSGMKTKVAEALMYNKPVVGTTEAFEGYEVSISEIGLVSNSADKYIKFIEDFDKFNFMNIRHVFLTNYSFDKINSNFYNFLNERNN